MSSTFLIYSIFAGMFVGIVSTSLLRIYLKKHIFFENFGLREIAKIFVSTSLASVLYALLSIASGLLFTLVWTLENEIDKKLFEMYNSFWLLITGSVFTVFGWVILYLVIKLLLKLNADRIERLELNATLKQAQLNTLKGQINPHFMFNSLNNIRGLMLEDVERSREMLTKLSDMLRYSLSKNNVNAIVLKDELEMVDNYIDLSRIQFEDRMTFIKEVVPESLHLEIPPMIVQLLVENAAKHGIGNLKEGGVIKLITKVKDQVLHIQVINSGKLKIDTGSTQLGLQNIKQRLKLLYGGRATFSLEQLEDEVMAHIKIPIQ
ncbi:sensor histidine kinase [Lentiprolixibacter aurantiacus]|uniref:Histidine kinase n=1 Tax=Lentiprolixibacter aurantiacus TaxID=2993939 RepID=A0AAE3MNL6_9FLAO|nr:histidine kinase [Lentiprolixibacter aurantiacus]MCX2720709.1 histidine kinase [Lentiprolixibacter aurantiacus]